MNKLAVLVRVNGDLLVMTRDADENVMLYDDEAHIERMMKGHILEKCQRQIVEVEI